MRRGRDSNPGYPFTEYDGLANRWFQPLTHLSGAEILSFNLELKYSKKGKTMKDFVQIGFVLAGGRGTLSKMTDFLSEPGGHLKAG
jgi:hypothetical protein